MVLEDMPMSTTRLGLAAGLTSLAIVMPAAIVPAVAQSGPRCHATIEGVGTGQGLLGAGTRKARAAAVSDFEQKATSLHGARYGKFANAKNVKTDCRSGTLEAKCVITARPCR
jgi:hypothetical protein